MSVRVEGLSVLAVPEPDGRIQPVIVSFAVRNTADAPTERALRTTVAVSPPPVSGPPAPIVTEELGPGRAVYVSQTLLMVARQFELRVETDQEGVVRAAPDARRSATARFSDPVADVGRWVSIGPTLIRGEGLGATGRVTAIAIPRTDRKTIYAAGISGQAGRPKFGGSGVWKTTTGGSSWLPIADSFPSLMVSALAVDPLRPTRIYAATLDPQQRGAGLFRSDDAGVSWILISDDDRLSGPDLLIDPTNSSTMFMGSTDAVVRSLDGGATWASALAVEDATISDLLLDPARPRRLWAGVFHETLNSRAGVYETDDGGVRWTKLVGCPGGQLPAQTAGRTIRLAISGQRRYVSFKTKEEWVLYRTTGAGCSIGGRPESNWERGWSAGSDVAPTIWSRLYADPSDSSFVYATGTNFRRSTDGGMTFDVVDGPHVDHHAFAVDPSDPTVIYTGSDGGVYRSTDRGRSGSWAFAGDGMANTEFYDIADAATEPALLIGGTQDNGTILHRSPRTVWDHIAGGDGATSEIDPRDGEVMYSMGQYAASIKRQSHGGGWKPFAQGLPMGSVCFNLHYQVHPAIPTTLLASCGGSLWRTTTTDPPGNWQMIFPPGAPPPAGGVVRSAIDGSRDLYYAATNMGELYAGVNGRQWQRVFNWLDLFPATSAPKVVDVEVDLDDPSTVYIALDGRGQGRVLRLRRLADGRMDAADITGDLPADLLVSALAVDRMRPLTIYAGTETCAVYRGQSRDGGRSWAWTSYANGLPAAVAVRDLEVHPTTGVMRAATFGRGAYEVNTDNPIGSVLAAEGVPTLLRVHDVGTKFGPPTDQIDVEVVVRLDTDPRKAFGFQLRSDQQESRHRGMLDLLRNAFADGARVRVEYVRTGLRNGLAHRVQRLS